MSDVDIEGMVSDILDSAANGEKISKKSVFNFLKTFAGQEFLLPADVEKATLDSTFEEVGFDIVSKAEFETEVEHFFGYQGKEPNSFREMVDKIIAAIRVK